MNCKVCLSPESCDCACSKCIAAKLIWREFLEKLKIINMESAK